MTIRTAPRRNGGIDSLHQQRLVSSDRAVAAKLLLPAGAPADPRDFERRRQHGVSADARLMQPTLVATGQILSRQLRIRLQSTLSQAHRRLTHSTWSSVDAATLIDREGKLRFSCA